MKSNLYTNLEDDFQIKKAYLRKTTWWKSFLFIAPIALLFTGLVGILFLQKGGMLLSWYSIPYILIFVVGTLLFKSVRLHLTRVAIKKPDAFLACSAQMLGDKEGYVYAVFMTNFRRHDEKFISNLSKELDTETIINENLKLARKKTIILRQEGTNNEYCLRAFDKKSLSNLNPDWIDYNNFPIYYIEQKYAFPIKRKHITECRNQ